MKFLKTYAALVAALISLIGLFGFLLPKLVSMDSDFGPLTALAVVVIVVPVFVFLVNKVFK